MSKSCTEWWVAQKIDEVYQDKYGDWFLFHEGENDEKLNNCCPWCGSGLDDNGCTNNKGE